MRLTHIFTCTCLYFSDTFGIQSLVITETTGGRVCLECSFYTFSTDTECTVELVSSDSSSALAGLHTEIYARWGRWQTETIEHF